MSVHAPASYPVAARLRKPRTPETRQQRTDHHHRPSERSTSFYKVFTLNIFSVNVVRLESPASLLCPRCLYPHCLQQVNQVLHVEYFRYIAYGYLIRSKKSSADNLQCLVLGTLGSDFSAQFISSFYYECIVFHFSVQIISTSGSSVMPNLSFTEAVMSFFRSMISPGLALPVALTITSGCFS